ncbi:MAG: tRNA guanosine(34) transglycosylase Tgt [Bacteroidales bacterium]|jgi:queuine tRNA-ribosyltransferase|nr:tRNA guanosine(34) transglycosylase Tgt [Bacteroidales bacterium]
MFFKIEKTDLKTSARCGTIFTEHGEIQTPIFMPVGTCGTVKGVHTNELKNEINAQIILGNTYHLYLRPGIFIINQAGGLHKFNGWDRPILTDSGGFQVFSLAKNRKLTEEGAVFKSHIDGSKHIFSPENVVEIQRNIGADIMMAFDECTPFPCEKKYAKNSLELTNKWLQRGWKKFNETMPLYGYKQFFFPIVQGSVYPDLRIEATKFVSDIGAEGNAIGGLSVGEQKETMYEILEIMNENLPKDKPRYLMGVGTPENLLEGIERGVDMFDCVMPTRNARNGMLFTENGTINIKNEKWKNDFSPIDENGTTFVDTFYSKAYLRHLVIANEILASQISSIHNLGFYLRLMEMARNHILDGNFSTWKKAILNNIMQRI